MFTSKNFKIGSIKNGIYLQDEKRNFLSVEGAIFFNYKIGSKVKLYYNKNNPNDAFPKSELGITAVPLVIGTLFVYIGVYIVIDDRKKRYII